jgi:uncharacterized protein YbjT (DUF2867 family)
MRIAVFGATGVVGRALVPRLAERNEVVAVSRHAQPLVVSTSRRRRPT